MGLRPAMPAFMPAFRGGGNLFLTPLRGSHRQRRSPTACAMGYILAALQGSSRVLLEVTYLSAFTHVSAAPASISAAAAEKAATGDTAVHNEPTSALATRSPTPFTAPIRP